MTKKHDDSPKPSLPSEKDTNQTRKVGMPMDRSNFARIEQENPFVKMASNPCGGKKRGR